MTGIHYRGAERQTERIKRWVQEWGRATALAFKSRNPDSLGQLYDYVISAQNSLGEESLYLNFGYWKKDPQTLDEASENLARLVADEAHLGPHDVIIDVGCGFGDQNFLWAREFQPSQIIGVNISSSQIEIANARAQTAGVSGVVQYVHGSADNLPQPDSSATKVTAVESAFHFQSRAGFFSEAFRVLKPGGRIVTADIVAVADAELPLGTRRLRPLGRIVQELLMIGRHDQMDAGQYRNALLLAGFDSVNVYSIRKHVYAPYANFMRKRLRDLDMRRVNPAGRIFFGPLGVGIWAPWLDYIVAVADKPSAPQE